MIRNACCLVAVFGLAMAWAQWECPSRLGAALTPIGSSNVQFGAEFTHSIGLMNIYSTGDSGEEVSNMTKISNDMLFFGLDYTTGKHAFYAEGGVKYWSRVDSVFERGQDLTDDSTAGENSEITPGLRELFYTFKGENHNFTIGEQTAKSDDYYLVNERMVGLNYRFTYGRWIANLLGGSVLKSFARNGTFCSVGYMQSIVPRRERTIIGNDFGQTNFAMLSVQFHPSAEVSENFDQGETSEFSSEFSSGREESSTKMLNWNTLGLVIYDEMGSWVDTSALLVGLYTELGLAETFSLKPEVLYQRAQDNNGLIYSLQGEMNQTWSNGWQTKALVRYLGMMAFDSLAKAHTSFTNIFAGEILRLDAMDLPFLQVGLKHSFTGIRTSIKFQMAKQLSQRNLSAEENALGLGGKKFTEYDLTLSKNIGENFLLSLTGGFLDYFYLHLPDDIYATDYYTGNTCLFGKVELRVIF